MKKIIISTFFMLFAFFTGCQKEVDEVQDYTNINLSKTSPLTSLVSRVVQNPTSKDNILDDSSCFSVVLPVTVTVNMQQITVSNESQYQLVKNAKDAYSNDNDIVYFNFPITLKYKDSQTELVTSQIQFNTILNQCPDDDGFDEIECVSVNYPIVINQYNSSSQIANTVTFQNDLSFYTFLNGLQSGIFYSVVYPISVVNSDGTNITISNNEQLENLIENSANDCSNTIVNPEFNAVLTSGSWYVSYYFDNTDETANYLNYNFTFLSNGTVIAVKNGNSSGGTWNKYVDDGKEKLDLQFSNSNLDELSEDWRISEYSATEIRLKHVSGGNGGTDYLYLTKN